MVLVMEKGITSMLLLILFTIMAVFGLCKGGGAVYKVGDSAGWTIIGNLDYNSWASSKTFQVGDTILFEYNPLYHNVLEVNRSEFHTCDATAPIARFSSGNDSIVIRSPGHYYYICSFVGHCQAGQKVDIRVPRSVLPPAIPPTLSPVPSPVESPVEIASAYGPEAPSPAADSSGESVLRCNSFFCGQMAHIGFLLILVRVLY